MAVEARLADGSVLRFPDGTKPEVVQRAVKQHVTGNAAPAAPKPQPSSPIRALYDYGRAKGAERLADFASRPGPRVPDLPTIGAAGEAIGHNFMEGARSFRDSYVEKGAAVRQGKSAGIGSDGRELGGLVNMVMSPITGLQDVLWAKPVSQATGFSEDEANMALMAMRPGAPGRLPPLRARPPRVPHPTTIADVPQPVARRAASYVDKVRRGMTPDQIAATGAPTTAEALGKPGEVAVSALARRTGATADGLAGHIGERQIGRPGRLQEDVARASGLDPETTFTDIRTQAAAQRETARPLYETAYTQPPPQSPKLDALLKRPSMREAMGKAVKLAAEQDRAPAEIGFKVRQRPGPQRMVEETWTETVKTPGGGTRDVTHRQSVPARGEMVDEMYDVEHPTMETWDYIKQGLDDVLEGYRDGTTGRLNLNKQGRAVLGTLNDLRAELTNPATEGGKAYRAALDAGGDPLRLEDAFRRAPDALFNGKLNEQQFTEMLSGLDQHGARSGVVNRWHDLLQNGKLDPKVLRTPRVRAKLEILFGRDQARAMIQSAEREARMQAFERRASPGNGSPTQELNAAMAEQDAGGGLLGDVIDRASKGEGIRGSVTGALASRAQGVAANLRTPGMSIPVRDEAGRLLLMSPDDYAAYLRSVPPRQRARLPDPKLFSRGYVAGQPLLQKRDR